MENTYTLIPNDYTREETESAESKARSIIRSAPAAPEDAKLSSDNIWTFRANESFEAFFDWKSVIFTVLGFVALIASVALIIFSATEGNFWMAIFLPLGVSIGLAIVTAGMGVIYPSVIVGFLVKLIVAPVLFPVYKHLCREWNRDNPVRIRAIKAELDERVAAYTEGFEAAAREASSMYAQHEISSMICEKITDAFLSNIGSTKRDRDMRRIIATYEFFVSLSGVIYGYYKEIKFEDYRCKPLPDPLSMTAFGYALIDGASARIRALVEKDPSGTPYDISYTISYDENGVLNATLIYSAGNGNFEELSDWGASTEFSGKE